MPNTEHKNLRLIEQELMKRDFKIRSRAPTFFGWSYHLTRGSFEGGLGLADFLLLDPNPRIPQHVAERMDQLASRPTTHPSPR